MGEIRIEFSQKTQTLEVSRDEALAALLFLFGVVLPKTSERSLVPSEPRISRDRLMSFLDSRISRLQSLILSLSPFSILAESWTVLRPRSATSEA